MTHAAIMLAGYDPSYLRITEHQVRGELRAGRTPVIIDGTAIASGAHQSFDPAVLRAFRLPTPGSDLKQRMAALGVEVLQLTDYLDGEWDAPLDREQEETLRIAVESALITYFRTDLPARSKRLVRKTERRLVREGRGTYRGTRAILAADRGIDTLYLPNGRFPHQKMAYVAVRDTGLSLRHFEKGETQNGTYLQDYAPQDRLASQGAVEPILKSLTTEEIEEIADAWLVRRAPSRNSSNEFSALWGVDLPDELRGLSTGDQPVAGFFTSSQDEFQFLGPEWQLHEWTSQFEAFDSVMTRLETEGYRCYLRVHPNLSTKAQECFVRERAGIRWLAARHPNLVVVWHDDNASTYALLDLTDAAVVWDSTVGLEASARGIPVWTMATSRYGLVADVHELLSPDQLEADGVKSWKVDPHHAKRFIAYLVLRDEQMDPDYASWMPWDPAHPPFGARLAAVTVAGGAPNRSEALRSVIDVYRHRSARSNLRHLRGY